MQIEPTRPWASSTPIWAACGIVYGSGILTGMRTPTRSAPTIAQADQAATPPPNPDVAPSIPVSEHPGLIRRIWGVIATILSVIILFVFLIPAAIVTRFNSHLVTPLQKLMSRIILTLCGIEVEVRGLENLAGIDQYIAVSNHQSLLDILVLILYAPGEMRFVAKREIRQVPLVGFVLHHSENIVIDRRAGGKAIRRAIDVVRHGYSICVFAEGHRYSDNQVHEFSDGAAWLAALTKLPCVPLAISGTASMMPRGSRFVIPGAYVRLTFGRSINAEEVRGAERAELTRQLESAVRSAFSASF
jgi:1-acyl-sn-glycerol-3-phosphate acyltransferase